MNAKTLPILRILFTILFAAGCATATPAPTSLPVPPTRETVDSREVYRSGLIPTEQDIISELPGATEYAIQVQISTDYTSLQGSQQVTYTNTEAEPLEEIFFRLYPNMLGGASTISALTVNGAETQISYEPGRVALRVPLTEPLQPGDSTPIKMDFEVDIPTQSSGNYGLFGYIDNILVLDGFYPSIPVYDALGWHADALPPNADTTFNDASFYTVQVTAPADLVLVTSGVMLERSQPGELQRVTFAAGPARDFYIAASEQFTVRSQQVGQTLVNGYAFEERAEGAELALQTAATAIEGFSVRFGAYPYTEFDVVSTPMQGATGIEYPGITGINKITFDPSETVSGQPAFVTLEATVAHEVGHQWFYNAVGNDQANEPWLDEALTQYVTGLYFLDRYGQAGMNSYRASWVNRWERVERQEIPIGRPAGDYVGREYSAIVYGRGPLFIEALAEKMGQDHFDSFLRAYYQSNAWHIATGVGFKQLAEQHCQCDLSDLFKKWVNE